MTCVSIKIIEENMGSDDFGLMLLGSNNKLKDTIGKIVHTSWDADGQLPQYSHITYGKDIYFVA